MTTSSFSSRAERPHAPRTLAVLAIVGSTALGGCSSGHESRSNTRTHQSPVLGALLAGSDTRVQAPVLMINGDAGEVIPVAAADALHNAAREPKQVEWYHGGHSSQGIEAVMQLAVVSAWLGKYFT